MAELTRRAFTTYAGIGALCALAATSSHTAMAHAEDAQPSQVIVTMTPGSEPAAGFDPMVAWGCGDHVHEPLIQSTLFTTNQDLTFKNDLATDYSCSDDGLTWTFHIRDDVKFTDGVPLTAEDVAFTIDGIAHGEAAQADLSMVDHVEAPDATTVVLTLSKPFNPLLYTLAVVGIVPKHAYGPDYGSNPIGSGRYMLEQWDRGQQVILKANPDYYGEKPQIDRLIVLFMSEDASLAAAMSGTVDVAYTSAIYSDIQPKGYNLLACTSVDSRGTSLPCVPAGGTTMDGGTELPVGNDVTCNLSIRRAINYGIDRQKIVQYVLNGYGTLAYSVGDGLPWSSPDMVCDYDPQLAQDILLEDGWTPGKDGVMQKDGLRASIDLYYPAGDSVRQAISAEITNELAEIGIEILMHGASWDEITLHSYSDLIMWGWGSNAPVELYEMSYSTGWGNYSSYEDPIVDGYLDKAVAEPHIEDSYEWWKKAQWDGSNGIAPQGAATWAWLVNVDHLYFVRENLHVADQKPHPHGHGWSLVNNIDQWSWE